MTNRTTERMSTSPDANELLDRSAALLQSQSTLIDTLLRRCKDLHNDVEILRGTVKATVAERDKALARGEAKDAEIREIMADLAARTNQTVRLNAQVDVLLSKDGRNYCMKVEAERDAARAKLADAEKDARVLVNGLDVIRDTLMAERDAARAYWDDPRRDGSKATVPWDDKYLNELWKARVRDQIESALIAVGVIQ